MFEPLHGCDDLRRWLLYAKGYAIHRNHLVAEGNQCNWLAARRSDPSARHCDTNDRPPQIAIYPYQMRIGSATHQSVEVDLTGEFAGVWYNFRAYSLTHDEVREHLDDIERQLVRAWNALGGDDD